MEELPISKAIERLQAILAEHGDLNVATMQMVPGSDKYRFCVIPTFEVATVEADNSYGAEKLCVLVEPTFLEGESDEPSPGQGHVN